MSISKASPTTIEEVAQFFLKDCSGGVNCYTFNGDRYMSRIEEAFRILRSIERGEPQPTASHREAEREYWDRKAAQAESPAELERIRTQYMSTHRVY